jgi:hypothetical protein
MWLKKGPSPPSHINSFILQHPISNQAKLRKQIRIDVDRGSWKHSDRLTNFFKVYFSFFSCFTLPDPALLLLLRDSAHRVVRMRLMAEAGQDRRYFSINNGVAAVGICTSSGI